MHENGDQEVLDTKEYVWNGLMNGLGLMVMTGKEQLTSGLTTSAHESIHISSTSVEVERPRKL
jgi:hypothetical protein